MISEDDIVRYIVDFSKEKQNQTTEMAKSIADNVDPVVNFLRKDEPIQFVQRGFILCENKIKELASKHIPDSNIHNLKFTKLLELVNKKGFLKDSETAPYKKLRDLRNEVAHHLEYQVKTKDATSIWDAFNREQREEIQRKSGMNRANAKDNPDILVKIMILRLYTHLSHAIESESMRKDINTLLSRQKH